MELIRLNLRAPLEYAEASVVPFEGLFPAADETAEFVFGFDLDPEQAVRIDPDPGFFPGELVLAGKRRTGQAGRKVLLPEGLYAFAQERRELDRGECVAMAIELQKDALWERLRLDSRLYIRFLFEDGSPVTQFFRPCSQ
ncbi:MAG: hypothetical protein FWD88_02110 [Treponema sp.]|nr:hypothetical protein [Treponema sp.]